MVTFIHGSSQSNHRSGAGPASAVFGSWEVSVADQIAESATKKQSHHPYMVALTGIPGSGKTLSSLLLQSLLEDRGLLCMVTPHDGYHYPIEYLKTHFADSESAIYRRGAPDTFDPAGLFRDLNRIRNNPDNEIIVKMPGFDHAKGDPEPEKHIFDRRVHNVVICEGLYLLHDKDGWETMATLFDLTIFLNQDLEACIQRVKIRNRVIPGYTPEEIDERTDRVDRVNAITILESSKQRADLVVQAYQRVPQDQLEDAKAKHELPAYTSNENYEDEDDDDLEIPENTAMAVQIDSDWTMDISTRPRSDSLAPSIVSRPETPVELLALVSDNEPRTPPPPAAQFAGTWEPAMALQLKSIYESKPDCIQGIRPLMVALVGLPGGGKSACSFMLANALDGLGLDCFVTPHDGYHYPLEFLRTQQNADDLIYRRGAPETFDPAALRRDLRRIRGDGDGDFAKEEVIIKLPAFNHARGDPEPDTHVFDRHRHKVVLCEGLYLLHNDNGWENMASIFDLSIFLDTPLEMCLERVKIRNQCIPGYTPEEIAVRTEVVDRANAMIVLRSRERADFVQQVGKP